MPIFVIIWFHFQGQIKQRKSMISQENSLKCNEIAASLYTVMAQQSPQNIVKTAVKNH